MQAMFILLPAAIVLQADIQALCLGTCNSLMRLGLATPQLSTLDLEGCRELSQLALRCCSLTSLDAKFCSQLADEAVAAAVKHRPPLKELVLSVCCQVSDQVVLTMIARPLMLFKTNAPTPNPSQAYADLLEAEAHVPPRAGGLVSIGAEYLLMPSICLHDPSASY